MKNCLKTFTVQFLTILTVVLSIEAEELTKENSVEKVTFGGGCFWCMEGPFEIIEGVQSVVSGYSGGKVKNPSYEAVTSGSTGHAEVVQVTWDPKLVSFEKILSVFWMNIDPTTLNRQFADSGTQYRTAIFYHSDEQKKLAEKSKQDLAKSGKFSAPIVTEISEFTEFYPAEDYHQDFYKKNPIRYKAYSIGSGRRAFIKKIWGK